MITLEDNSKKYFLGYSIELIYYRTIAQGIPYYTKFGFKYITPLKVRNNETNWNTKPIITKSKIIKLFDNNIDKDIKDSNDIINVFNKIVDKYTDNIIVSDFVIKLFDKAVKKEKDILEKRNIKNNLYAKILFLLLKDLYIESGYTLLHDNNFVLYLL